MNRDAAAGPAPVPPAGQGGIDVSLPLAFGAFCLLYGEHYRAYAQCRLGEPAAAEHTVRCALGELLIGWPSALTSLPSAVGWGILRRRTAIALHTLAPAGPDTLHRLLPVPIADVAVLHHGLGLSPESIADLTGCTPGWARYGLLTFERHLARQSDGTLRAAVEELRAARLLSVVPMAHGGAADPGNHAAPGIHAAQVSPARGPKVPTAPGP
jgi:hypothetical protein